MTITAVEAVMNGAELLNKVHPGWHTLIDPEALDISDGDRCILGQLYGGYRYGLERLDGHMTGGAEQYGFLCCDDGRDPVTGGYKCTCEELDEQWRIHLAH